MVCGTLPNLNKFINLTSLSVTNTKIEDKNCINDLTNLTTLSIINSPNFRENMPDFSKMTSLETLKLESCGLWSEDLEKLLVFANKKNMSISLKNNAITDISTLLKLDPSTKLTLTGNVNISQDAKNQLTEHFGKNVSF